MYRICFYRSNGTSRVWQFSRAQLRAFVIAGGNMLDLAINAGFVDELSWPDLYAGAAV